MELVQLKTKEPLTITVDDVPYYLDFSFPTVAALEEKLGRSMKSAPDWFRIQTAELSDVIRLGLAKHHADQAEAIAGSIFASLDPESIEVVIEGLCAVTWPKATERIRNAVEKARQRAEAGKAPVALPNVQSADVS